VLSVPDVNASLLSVLRFDACDNVDVFGNVDTSDDDCSVGNIIDDDRQMVFSGEL